MAYFKSVWGKTQKGLRYYSQSSAEIRTLELKNTKQERKLRWLTARKVSISKPNCIEQRRRTAVSEV
jgi:hypothetical protein